MTKRRVRAPDQSPPGTRVVELDARLGLLEAVLSQTQQRVELVLERLEELKGVRELALEAVAQAQDAHEGSRLAVVHEDRLNNLTLAVAEGIAHVERAEARIRATVGRARRELRDAGLEDPGVAAEAGQIFTEHDDPGRGPRVPAVPADLGPDSRVDPLEAQLRTLKLWRGA